MYGEHKYFPYILTYLFVSLSKMFYIYIECQKDKMMGNNTITNLLQRRGGFIKANEVKTRGEYEQLRRATANGTLLRIRNGLYVETSALANNKVDVERIIPGGVLYLYSAFFHYGLSTRIPSSFCIAIDAKRKVRLPDYPLIDINFWKKENLAFGVTQMELFGNAVRITDLERTVCDAVKYRNNIGIDSMWIGGK